MKKYQICGAIFLFVFAVFICAEALNLGLGKIGTPGPGFFPFGMGSALVIVSLVLAVKISRERAKQLSPSDLWGSSWRNIPYSLAAMMIYVLFLDRLGYLLATSFFLFFLFRVIGSLRWTASILGTLISSFSTYYLFKILLQVSLPKGLFGI